MTYEYDDGFDDEDYSYDDHDEIVEYQGPSSAQRAADWGINGSILVIIILTLLYALSPIDFVPDLIPVAGQADDIAAILAGGGSITFLTILRYALRHRIVRWTCLIVVVLMLIGTFTVFWVLINFFNSLV
jgi:hypothetical protein